MFDNCQDGNVDKELGIQTNKLCFNATLAAVFSLACCFLNKEFV